MAKDLLDRCLESIWSCQLLSMVLRTAVLPCLPQNLPSSILGDRAIRSAGMLPPLLMMPSVPDMACGSRYSYAGVHGCKWHERTPPRSGTIPPLFEIHTPLPVRHVRMGILIPSIVRYFMGLPGPRPWFLWTGDRIQTQSHIHIFMDRCLAVVISPTLQIGSHTAVPVYSVVVVVDFFDLLLDLLFLGIMIRLPVFPVVIIGIRADPQPP